MTVHGNSEKSNDNKTDNEWSEKSTLQPTLRLDRELTMEELAPDGGWGWMIAAGMIVTYLVSVSGGTSFGLLYGEFLDESGSGGSALAAMNLTFMISFSSSGLICNELLKKYSIKPVGVLGAAIFGFANTVVCFVPNVSFLAMSFSLQGIGIGIMMNVCNISLNAYFVKRKTKVVGATQVIIGFGGILYPILIEKLLSTYGFRGTLALLGALSLHAIASMLLMDPVERHHKKSKNITQKDIADKDQKLNIADSHDKLFLDVQKIETNRRHSMVALQVSQKNKSVQSLRAEVDRETPLLIESLKGQAASVLDIESELSSKPREGSSLNLLSNKLSVMVATSTPSITGIVVFGKTTGSKAEEPDEKKKSVLSILADFFEVSLLRDVVYLNLIIGMSFVVLSDIIFNGFFPMIMAEKGYTKTEIALTLTVAAITEVVSRIFFTAYSAFFNTKARHIFLGAVYSTLLCRMSMLYCNTLMSTTIVVAFHGLARTWFVVPQPLVVAEHFRIEKFPAAWGLYSVMNGGVAIIVCPLIGIMKDWTQSYLITQYLLMGIMMLCLVSWTIEIVARCIFDETPNKK